MSRFNKYSSDTYSEDFTSDNNEINISCDAKIKEKVNSTQLTWYFYSIGYRIMVVCYLVSQYYYLEKNMWSYTN